MPNQTARQQARRAALDAQTRMRQARAEQERRRSGFAERVGETNQSNPDGDEGADAGHDGPEAGASDSASRGTSR